MSKSSIEWTDETWNMLRARRTDTGKVGWHCEKVSAGCAHCYSETFNGRGLPAGGTRLPYTKPSRAQVETFVDEDRLDEPTRWRKPRRVFVCSMTDLFGEWVTDEQIDRVFDVMEQAGGWDYRRGAGTWHAKSFHTFQVLTKRAARMRSYVEARLARRKVEADAFEKCPTPEMRDSPAARWARLQAASLAPWIHIGVSVEDQPSADERIPLLLETPAAVRWISLEPMLARVRLRMSPGARIVVCTSCGSNRWQGIGPCGGCGAQATRGIDWVVVGGESGPGARPCNVAWIRSIVEQCRAANVPAFVKQCGANPIGSERERWAMAGGPDNWTPSDGVVAWKLRHPKGGDMSEWPEDLRVREFPEVRA